MFRALRLQRLDENEKAYGDVNLKKTGGILVSKRFSNASSASQDVLSPTVNLRSREGVKRSESTDATTEPVLTARPLRNTGLMKRSKSYLDDSDSLCSDAWMGGVLSRITTDNRGL